MGNSVALKFTPKPTFTMKIDVKILYMSLIVGGGQSGFCFLLVIWRVLQDAIL